MTYKKVAIAAGLILVVLPIAMISTLYIYFYSVFYFPNWAGVDSETLVSSGEKRQYLLYVPKSYDQSKPTPLVIVMHTSMSWPTSAMNISQWNLIAEEQGFIVVYPAGTGRGSKSWEMTASNTPSHMPDVIYMATLIDHMEASYNIDKTRIYANGMSNGGAMAFVLSCTLFDRIAAIGMVSPGLYPDWNWCNENRPMPLIAFHGTADPIAPYYGGHSKFGDDIFPSVPRFVESWAQRNQCAANPIDTSAAQDVTRRQYRHCAAGADVVFYTLHGEGHQWPGGKPIVAHWMVGAYSRSIDATRLMWTFFREHQALKK